MNKKNPDTDFIEDINDYPNEEVEDIKVVEKLPKPKRTKACRNAYPKELKDDVKRWYLDDHQVPEIIKMVEDKYRLKDFSKNTIKHYIYGDRNSANVKNISKEKKLAKQTDQLLVDVELTNKLLRIANYKHENFLLEYNKLDTIENTETKYKMLASLYLHELTSLYKFIQTTGDYKTALSYQEAAGKWFDRLTKVDAPKQAEILNSNNNIYQFNFTDKDKGNKIAGMIKAITSNSDIEINNTINNIDVKQDEDNND